MENFTDKQRNLCTIRILNEIDSSFYYDTRPPQSQRTKWYVDGHILYVDTKFCRTIIQSCLLFYKNAWHIIEYGLCVESREIQYLIMLRMLSPLCIRSKASLISPKDISCVMNSSTRRSLFR